MINKFFKRIHSKYSTLFKFIFFLRYLFAVFFLSIILFLFIPHIIDYKKKDKIIKKHVLESYNIDIKNYENIKYNPFPIPHLEINNTKFDLETDLLNFSAKSFKIYPKLVNIYNFENFEIKKIILKNNTLFLKDSNFKIFIKSFLELDKKFSVSDLDIKIKKQKKDLIDLKNISFSNYGYKKNQVKGKLFNKKFKIIINDDFSLINFKLLKTGINADIIFIDTKNQSVKKGILKSKFLNSHLKLNFDFDTNFLKIYNSNYRSKDLSFKINTIIKYNPFFYLDSRIDIQEINADLFENFDLNKILSSKELIKRLNIKNKISYKSDKLSRNIIDELTMNLSLAYGRLSYNKKILISKNIFKCSGDVDLLQEFPILYFDCLISSDDKKNLLKSFSIKNKSKNESFQLKTSGYLNLLNNKINFKDIFLNQAYKASKEDLDYFKKSFETIIFNQNFINIFDIRKIKNFIIEIS